MTGHQKEAKKMRKRDFYFFERRTWSIIPSNNNSSFHMEIARPGKSYWSGRLSTVDLLIKIGCFVKVEKYSFRMKSS
jgi:hypothetical protein